MKNLLAKINMLHINYEVLASAVLHLSEEEQVKVNKLITESLGLPIHATASSIKNERQKRVDGLDEYGVIMDAFTLLKRVTAVLEGKAEYDAELAADARMIIGSIENE